MDRPERLPEEVTADRKKNQRERKKDKEAGGTFNRRHENSPDDGGRNAPSQNTISLYELTASQSSNSRTHVVVRIFHLHTSTGFVVVPTTSSVDVQGCKRILNQSVTKKLDIFPEIRFRIHPYSECANLRTLSRMNAELSRGFHLSNQEPR